MSTIREINLDTITPLVDAPANDTIVATDTVATMVVAEPMSDPNTNETQANGKGGLLAWVGIGLSICVGVFAWRLIDNLKKDVKKLRFYCEDAKKNYDKLQSRIDKLNEDLVVASQQIASSRNSAPTRIVVPTLHEKRETYNNISEVSSKKAVTQIRYATMQSPDENGVLRFSERSMPESASPQKMFLLEIDPSTGSGTYRINPNAMDLIVSDLQMFQDFVKPFTFSGNPMKANVQDKKSGKIVKQGNFWVVEELLEISIH